MKTWEHEHYDDEYGRPCLRITAPEGNFRVEAVLERDGEVSVYEGTLCVLSFDHNYPDGAAKTIAVIAAREYVKEEESV